MCKEKSLDWRAISVGLGALLLSPLYLSAAFASSNGSVLSDQACSLCHSLDAANVMIVGPSEVLAHSDNTYSLSITGGPAVTGGMNVAAADGGVLSISDAATQLISGEITHTAPKAFSNNSVIWDFQWQAPGELGIYNIFGQGVSSNDGQGNNGDATGMTTFAVTVTAVPIPAAGVLFGSALGLLVWLRRKIA